MTRAGALGVYFKNSGLDNTLYARASVKISFCDFALRALRYSADSARQVIGAKPGGAVAERCSYFAVFCFGHFLFPVLYGDVAMMLL
jgi:hypothetical protein